MAAPERYSASNPAALACSAAMAVMRAGHLQDAAGGRAARGNARRPGVRGQVGGDEIGHGWPAAFARCGTKREVLGPGVVRRRPDDLVVRPLLDDVRAPAGGAGDDEQRREHRRRHAHHVVGDGAEPVEVRRTSSCCRAITVSMRSAIVEHLHRAGLLREAARDFLDDLVARIGDRVDRVAEADDHLLVGDAAAMSASASSGVA